MSSDEGDYEFMSDDQESGGMDEDGSDAMEQSEDAADHEEVEEDYGLDHSVPTARKVVSNWSQLCEIEWKLHLATIFTAAP